MAGLTCSPLGWCRFCTAIETGTLGEAAPHHHARLSPIPQQHETGPRACSQASLPWARL